ncbi:hypothetical protein GGX14DRAFT_677414 [Mycena pura]|uniref:Uncharacterized protein n=1 Tax=Mycena pura TaxID=153505 RepID=A0AAD6UUH2_9AGAR|nr:hypothetical protein GGX14DRAFT_677414 [Mycena pura]
MALRNIDKYYLYRVRFVFLYCNTNLKYLGTAIRDCNLGAGRLRSRRPAEPNHVVGGAWRIKKYYAMQDISLVSINSPAFTSSIIKAHVSRHPMDDSKPAVAVLQPAPVKQKKEEHKPEPPPAGDSFETAVRALEEARTAILAARDQLPAVTQVPMIPVAEAEEQQAAALRTERLRTATATQQAAALRAEIARLQAAAATQQAAAATQQAAAATQQAAAATQQAKARVREAQLVRVQKRCAQLEQEREDVGALERERTDIAQRLRGLAQFVEAKGTSASSASVPLRRAAPESGESDSSSPARR